MRGRNPTSFVSRSFSLSRHLHTSFQENGTGFSGHALISFPLGSLRQATPDLSSLSPAHHNQVSSSSQRTISSLLSTRWLDSLVRSPLFLPSRLDRSTSCVRVHSRGFSAARRSSENRPNQCWACEHEISGGSGLFCPSCNAIQALDLSVDHFTVFGIQRSFEMDTKLLEQKYKSLQKKLHPDLMSSKSQKEQGYSADQSSHVIQAYFTLLRPLSRARYLLGLHGFKVDEEGTIDDPALLMEIMEIRESLEDASNTKELRNLQAQNNVRIQDTEKVLVHAFGSGDLKKAVSWVQRLAYYNKVDEEIIRKL